MNETQLLNETLQVMNDKNNIEAYEFLLDNIYALDLLSSQVYNFLYCLAATINRKDEAIKWLQEAIFTKELWYRPEVFEDTDLDSIREDIRFKECCDKSEERYNQALSYSKTVCTWREKTHNALILVLHGNQQNNNTSKQHWDILKNDRYQVEYLQSEELDSYQLFRWEDDGTGPNQVNETILQIKWQSYYETILCGFSAGCNVILRTVRDKEIKCNKIILQSPWIPIVEDDLDLLIKQLKEKGIKLFIICGNKDEDCLPQCKLLERKAEESGYGIKAIYIEDLTHDYPENFKEIINSFLLRS